MVGRRRFVIFVTLLIGACSSPELLVGYARPGLVVRIRESDGRITWRDNTGSHSDEVLGIRRGPSRRLYLCSYRTSRILIYRESRQEFEGEFGRSATLEGPTDLLFLPDGNVLVACTGSNQFLLDEDFNAEGTALILLEGPKGDEPGRRITTIKKGDYAGVPTCLALGPDGTAYVGGRDSGQILRIELGKQDPGELARVIVFADIGDALNRGPMHIAFGPDGALYATSLFDTKVIRIDSKGVTTFLDDPELRKPAGLAFSKKGEHLFVASFGRGELRRYDAATGAFIDTFANELPQPWAVIAR